MPKRYRVAGHLVRGLCAAALFAAPTIAADKPFKPVLMRSENAGAPNERILSFRVNPEARKRNANLRALVGQGVMQKLADQAFQKDRAGLAQAANAEGWGLFNLGFGTTGSGGTFAENVLEMGGLKRVNSTMTNLGLFMTIWQVNMDLADGKADDAAINAYKGMMGFGIGTWGTSALQVANIGAFAIDVALQEFGKAAWLARTDAWRQAYLLYYNEMNAAEEKARLGAQPILSPTYDQRLTKIRGQVEGGRSVADWVFLIYHFQRNAKNKGGFEALLLNEVDAYVAKFWDSPRFNEYAVGDSGIWGLGRGTSLTQGIKTAVQDEYKTAVLAMLRKDVFPVIAHKTWLKNLEARVAHLEKTVKPVLNETVTLEFGVHGLTSSARIVIPKPSGGQWEAMLDPADPHPLEITKIAMARAGMPHEVSLDLPGGRQTRPFVLENDRAHLIFGTPATSVVTVYDRSEGPLSCTVRRTPRGGGTETTQDTRSAPGGGDLHWGSHGFGNLTLGRFNGKQWDLASPGAHNSAMTKVLFSLPRFEDIYALSNCDGSFLQGSNFVSMQCTVERRTSERTNDGTLQDTRCTSQATLKLKGAWSPIGGQMQYVAMDGAAGKALNDAIRKGIGQGVINPGTLNMGGTGQ